MKAQTPLQNMAVAVSYCGEASRLMDREAG